MQPDGELLLPGQFELGPEMEALSRLETEWGTLNVPELIALPGLEIEELTTGENHFFGQLSAAYSTRDDPFFTQLRGVIDYYNWSLSSFADTANSLLHADSESPEVESSLRTLIAEFTTNIEEYFRAANQASLGLQAALQPNLDHALETVEYIYAELRSRSASQYNPGFPRRARVKLGQDSPSLSRLYQLVKSWPPVDTLTTSPMQHPLGPFTLLTRGTTDRVQRPVVIHELLLRLASCLEFDDSGNVRTCYETDGGPLLAVLKHPDSVAAVVLKNLNECVIRLESLTEGLVRIGREESRDVVARGASEMMVRVTGFFGVLSDILRRAERLAY